MTALFPPLFRLRQTFERPRVDNIPATVDAELTRLNLGTKIKPGQSVAITAGSRGIANIAIIIKAIVAHVKHLGG
ncbi:MAG: [Fe-S]-binding protein, partial [Planctomycetaceae bacterium]|nr:[Fe-S]-binding protein [Planctomycetaceae bacterium]